MNLLDQARDWLAQDPDEETRAELSALLLAAEAGSREATSELHDRFDNRLEFGTAGLRGEIAAGPHRMNRVLVAQTAAGIANYLLEKALPGETPSVVIGYDGRKNSQIFATDTAELMAGAGIRAVLLPRPLPTPVVAFAVRHLSLSAGIMVTASHNPARDNGYKVYLGGTDQGSQIVSPADSEIENHILQLARSRRVPDLPRSQQYETAPETLIDDYVATTASVVTTPPPRQPRVVYTALHGVGWETLERVFSRAGFVQPTLVTAQIEPDATFPTVTFPNPEEPGALALAYETARSVSADLIIANDPDADRLAIAIPDPSTTDGYRRLTGNEVGALLGWRVIEQITDKNLHGAVKATVACSLVSSPALAAVATAYGVACEETLTGFKWVSRVPGLVFGYEEALGYLVNPDSVHDKDGISAAVAFLSLTAELAAEGITIAEQLDRFSERFGHFASAQISLRVTELSEITAVMTRLRANPPRQIGGLPIQRIDDLASGSATTPPSDILRIVLADGSRVMVRPSGTEPKLKIYLDVSSTEGSIAERKARATAQLLVLETGMREITA